MKFNSKEEFLNFINEAAEGDKINGTNFNQKNLDRYNELNVRVVKLFGENGESKFNIEQPDSTKKFISISIDTDLFEITPTNVDDFITILKLSDGVVITGSHENYFDIAFYIDDIYTEQ